MVHNHVHQQQHGEEERMRTHQNQSAQPATTQAALSFGARLQPDSAGPACEGEVPTAPPHKQPCARLHNPPTSISTRHNIDGKAGHFHFPSVQTTAARVQTRPGPRVDAGFLDVYTLAGKLGEGQGNAVMKCTHKLSGKEYAVKQLRNTTSALAELKCHELCDDHPLVVSVIESFLQATPPSQPKPQPQPTRRFGQGRRSGGVSTDDGWLVVVLELCKGGDLFDRLTAAPSGHFTEVSLASDHTPLPTPTPNQPPNNQHPQHYFYPDILELLIRHQVFIILSFCFLSALDRLRVWMRAPTLPSSSALPCSSAPPPPSVSQHIRFIVCSPTLSVPPFLFFSLPSFPSLPVSHPPCPRSSFSHPSSSSPVLFLTKFSFEYYMYLILRLPPRLSILSSHSLPPSSPCPSLFSAPRKGNSKPR